jgi:DNA topoisomerase-1
LNAVTSLEPRRSAVRARLRYVDDTSPGLHRVRCGRAFRYVDHQGAPVRDADTIRRVRALAIPPAWTDVWICRDPRGHLQATGRDARGRKQYRYHAEFRAVREAAKFDSLLAIGRALPRLRATIDAHLADRRLSRRRVLAAVARLLDATGMRVGNEEYARQNGTYGVTTLRNRHARLQSGSVVLRYKGKAGVRRSVTIDDPRLVRLVRRCHGLPCETLFAWVDDGGRLRPIRAGDVNAYLRRAAGVDMTAKCLRTWVATVRMAEELLAAGAEAPLRAALERVASDLGHTPTICRKSYVHPEVIEHHRKGTLSALLEGASTPPTREEVERMILVMLEKGAPRPTTLARAVPRAPIAAKAA